MSKAGMSLFAKIEAETAAGNAPLAERMRRLNDLFGVHPPHVAERMAVVAFDRLSPLKARADAITQANRTAYCALLAGHPRLEQTIFDQGATVFPRLVGTDGDAFFRQLTANFETSVVPGRFFGMPDHIRIGLGADPATTSECLARIASALDA